MDTAPNIVAHGAHRHFGTERLPSDPGRLKLVLVGNPNVGKSVVFNYLSGLYVDVSNFPGTTVEVSSGKYGAYDLFDTPGIYGVSSFNDEEIVARDIILNADAVLNIVDAVHLERDLFLTRQLIDMGKRVAVLVNLMDEAERYHMSIDFGALERELGVPVAGAVATRKQGLERLGELIASAREGNVDPAFHARLHDLLAITGSQAEALMILEGDDHVARRHGVSPREEREEIYVARRNRVNAIVERAVRDASTRTRLSARIGRLAVSPLFGIPILLLVLYLLYLFVGKIVAQDLVKFTEQTISRGIVEYQIKALVARQASTDVTVRVIDPATGAESSRRFSFPEGTANARALWEEAVHMGYGRDARYEFAYRNPLVLVLFGEFGAVTMTLTYVLFLLLPLVVGFYVALSILEDSGYLPRLATLVDRLLRSIGLNGRAIIPLILGFGCVTMATITTRLLGTQREKTIATTILQLAIPCSAQLGVIAALLATAGLGATILYTAVIFAFLASVGTLLDRAMPGSASPLLLDLPPMRFPRLDNVLRKTGVKTYFFMKEASPWFFIGAMLIGIFQVTGLLTVWQEALSPFTTGWLKLPKEAANAFVMGLVRRDFGAAGLYAMPLTPNQIVVALVTITLFVPCIASLMVMLKERGAKEGLLIWTGSWILAFAIGGALAQIII